MTVIIGRECIKLLDKEVWKWMVSDLFECELNEFIQDQIRSLVEIIVGYKTL